ncbi:hypothetical protein pEaSNUABM54_00070 [Erwinia phage pEa_SNUABM_54]|nr:hypothetical protein pEaSNUABM54_00070 [Erwinia phage pEa_SNUABM_54]
MFQKLRVKWAIKRAINNTYAAVDLLPGLVSVVTVYSKLTPEQKLRVWKSDFPVHYAFTPNLSMLSGDAYTMWLMNNGVPQLDHTIPVSPMEWLSGSTRVEMIEYLIDPNLKELGKLRDTVWQGLVRGDFSAVGLDEINNAQEIMRKILRGIRECL